MEAPRRNAGLKALDPDPAAPLERALALGAQDHGILEQRDTYFAAERGRLELREQPPGGAHRDEALRPGSYADALAVAG